MGALGLGDRVVYRTAFGSGTTALATIVGFGRKNDRPLVDLSDGHWAYVSQIDTVLERAVHS